MNLVHRALRCAVLCAALFVWLVSDARADAPRDVDFDALVVAHDLERVRHDPAFEAFDRALRTIALDDRSAQAWDHLARRLGDEPGAVFDRLFGTSVGVLMRRAGDGGDGAWVVFSRIDSQTDTLIKKRLNVAPRDVAKGGRLVLAVDDGRVLLTSWADRDAPGRVTLALAPGGQRALFDRVLDQPELARGLLERPRGVTTHVSIVARGSALPFGIGVPGVNPALKGWLHARVSFEGARARVAFANDEGALRRLGAQRVPMSTGADDVLWLSAHASRGELDRNLRMLRLGTGGDALDGVVPRGTTVLAASVRDKDQRVDLESMFDDVAMAYRVTGVAELPRRADAAFAEWSGGRDEFEGRLPGAVRTLTRRVGDSERVVSWGFVIPEGPHQREGWLVVAGDPQRARVLIGALGRTDAPAQDHGAVRPSSVLGRVDLSAIAFAPNDAESLRVLEGVLDALRGVERLGWHLSREAREGSRAGVVELRFADPAR
ncbi:MAG: hypothetical protein AAGD00_02005 [Planctomycetota bacterium]